MAKLLLGFPCGSAGNKSACNTGDLGLIPGLERSPGEVKGYPLQYSGLENSKDCITHGVTKSQTWLSNFHSLKLLLIFYILGSTYILVEKNNPTAKTVLKITIVN